MSDSTPTDSPLALQKTCMLHVLFRLEEFPVESIALLPVAIRKRLLNKLPLADILNLKTSLFSDCGAEDILETATRAIIQSINDGEIKPLLCFDDHSPPSPKDSLWLCDLSRLYKTVQFASLRARAELMEVAGNPVEAERIVPNRLKKFLAIDPPQSASLKSFLEYCGKSKGNCTGPKESCIHCCVFNKRFSGSEEFFLIKKFFNSVEVLEFQVSPTSGNITDPSCSLLNGIVTSNQLKHLKVTALGLTVKGVEPFLENMIFLLLQQPQFRLLTVKNFPLQLLCKLIQIFLKTPITHECSFIAVLQDCGYEITSLCQPTTLSGVLPISNIEYKSLDLEQYLAGDLYSWLFHCPELKLKKLAMREEYIGLISSSEIDIQVEHIVFNSMERTAETSTFGYVPSTTITEFSIDNLHKFIVPNRAIKRLEFSDLLSPSLLRTLFNCLGLLDDQNRRIESIIVNLDHLKRFSFLIGSTYGTRISLNVQLYC